LGGEPAMLRCGHGKDSSLRQQVYSSVCWLNLAIAGKNEGAEE
jgi:hypothetical protein